MNKYRVREEETEFGNRFCIEKYNHPDWNYYDYCSSIENGFVRIKQILIENALTKSTKYHYLNDELKLEDIHKMD